MSYTNMTVAERLNPQHAYWVLDYGPLAGQTLYLLTPEQLHALPPEAELYSIGGQRVTREHVARDVETRGGWLAYGLLHPLY